MSTVPDDQDFDAVARNPAYDDKTDAEKYRLAQATKLIRLYDAGKLPLPLMREMDKIRRKGGDAA